MKKIYITLQLLLVVSAAVAQNWSYVGAPYLNGHTAATTYLYFGDMEFDNAGNILVGYWEYTGKLSCTKYNGNSWTPLPSPGTFAASSVDVETYNNNYYMAYLGARSGNYYAFVRKYDGSNSWIYLGDSLLIGGVGQGGSFDFLLDNNGVPTLIGIQKAAFGDKTVKQFISGAWTNTDTIPGSAAAIFTDNAATFDASNKLCCVVSGTKTLTVPPYALSYTIGLKIDGATDSMVGDTIYAPVANSKFKIDNSGNAYLLFNHPVKAAFLSYKLNGNHWDLVSDTSGAAVGSMTNATITNDDKIIFSTLQSNNARSIYSYSSGIRKQLDSLNVGGFGVGGVSDIVIHNTDIYTLFIEVKPSAAADFSVMKHSINGGSSYVTNDTESNAAFNVYPNPASQEINLAFDVATPAIVEVTDINGRLMVQNTLSQKNNTLDVSYLAQGLYLVTVRTTAGIGSKKLLITR